MMPTGLEGVGDEHCLGTKSRRCCGGLNPRMAPTDNNHVTLKISHISVSS
jgi:hypothetical protein